jgi:hypothetical protein
MPTGPAVTPLGPTSSVLQTSNAGNKAANAARIVPIALALGLLEIRLLNDAHLKFEGDYQGDEADQRDNARIISVSPSAVGIMALKMGLRTRAKGPSVTSSVRSLSSTPILQESPMAICA